MLNGLTFEFAMLQLINMDITNPDIERYLFGLCPQEPEFIRRMEEQARKDNFPIVDRLVGRLLMLMARMKDPSLVVELGSGFGYSAYWFARGMRRGRVVLTDRDADNLKKARSMMDEAGLLGRAEFMEGDAMESAGSFCDIDILFIDMDKQSYLKAVKTFEPCLAPGGLVIADNTLWYGKVLTGEDDNARAIMEFNDYMFSHPGFDCSLVPLRDGVLVAMKKS